MSRESKVAEFHTAMDQEVGVALMDKSRDRVNQSLGAMRLRLIEEEFNEFKEAYWEFQFQPCPKNLEHLIKELADLQYVTSGFAATFNIDLGEAFRRVHESNMSKLDDDGNPIKRADGKVLKGPNYKPPYLEDLT